MALTPKGRKALRVLLLLLALAAVAFGIRVFRNRSAADPAEALNAAAGPRNGAAVPAGKGLGRKLKVALNEWPGFAGGIVANQGLTGDGDTLFARYGQPVEISLVNEPDPMIQAFQRGDYDIIWFTIDSTAQSFPGLQKSGVPVRVFVQVDWSRGGDGIVATDDIKRIEDLAGKRISLVAGSPSDYLLGYGLANSSVDPTQAAKTLKGVIGKNSAGDVRTDFTSGATDAGVLWEPDLSLAVNQRPGSHVLFSTATATSQIADVLVARADVLAKYPEAFRAFVSAWFDGTAAAERNPRDAARLLVQWMPTFKDLGEQTTLEIFGGVKLATLQDNIKTFGLDGGDSLFDRIFRESSAMWLDRGFISTTIQPSAALDLSALRAIYAQLPPEQKKPGPTDEFKFSAQQAEAKKDAPAVLTKPVSFYFASGHDDLALDADARKALDEVATLIKQNGNAYVRVEGNTDDRGGPGVDNNGLSQRRAQTIIDLLVKTYGFTQARFLPAVGNGPAKPVASNATDEGRRKNRRTDVMVVPR